MPVLAAAPPSGETVSAPAPHVVTADIQAGIEKHIEEQTRAGNGYFKLAFDEKQLQLKLVRVHLEYLANLGPRRHFACVDLAGTDGEVYDVDFFLAGDPGAMTVTETTVHKINGQPRYTWEQKRNGTWRRVPVKKASKRLLGVINGRDEFEFIYRVKLPQLSAPARMWLPLAQSDRFQTVQVEGIQAPVQWRELEDHAHGNNVLFLTASPAESGRTIEIRYRVQRVEKAAYAVQEPMTQKYLNPERLVPADENFRTLAEEASRGRTTDLTRARALYDHVIDRLRYMKFGAGWGVGDATRACDARTGNCSDFHAYFIALARAIGIPARLAIGAAIPSERNDGRIDGYHCWAEFLADGKWWPVDISEADKYSSLATYYFGHHPANRIELSQGRDLVVDPLPASGPINLLAYPVLEIAGTPVKAETEFIFRRIGAARKS
ncbi:MAG: transglutaminase domain-containing protein [Verrucomicrobia bacterium]|nr:transglutaminase domain-containing protein [Verrucomicrobiota bacterium]